jgi:phage baseplate assembly protein W
MAKLGVTKDIDINSNGVLVPVSGNNKIKQLILKALLTEEGANELFPSYGSELHSVIGDKFDTLAEFKLHNAVQKAIRFLIVEQINIPNLPLDETILSLLGIEISQDQVDPRIIRIVVNVQTGNFQQTQLNLGIVST